MGGFAILETSSKDEGNRPVRETDSCARRARPAPFRREQDTSPTPMNRKNRPGNVTGAVIISTGITSLMFPAIRKRRAISPWATQRAMVATRTLRSPETAGAETGASVRVSGVCSNRMVRG
jgi:hypothetical protein